MGNVGLDHALLSLPYLLTKTGSDMADQFPDAEVIGTDVSPMQPQWVPPNLRLSVSSSLLTIIWPLGATLVP